MIWNKMVFFVMYILFFTLEFSSTWNISCKLFFIILAQPEITTFIKNSMFLYKRVIISHSISYPSYTNVNSWMKNENINAALMLIWQNYDLLIFSSVLMKRYQLETSKDGEQRLMSYLILSLLSVWQFWHRES